MECIDVIMIIDFNGGTNMRVKLIEIFVDDRYENVPIAREIDEEAALKSGEDEYIYGYVPDDVFEMDDNKIAKYVEENLN